MQQNKNTSREKIVVIFQGTKLVNNSFIDPFFVKKNSIYLVEWGLHVQMLLISANNDQLSLLFYSMA